MPLALRVSVSAISAVMLVALLLPNQGNTGTTPFDWKGRRQTLQKVQAAGKPDSFTIAALATDLISAASAPSSIRDMANWQTWCDPAAMQDCTCIDGDPFICNVAQGSPPTGNHSARDPNFIDGMAVSKLQTQDFSKKAKKAKKSLQSHAANSLPEVTLTLQDTIHINPRIRYQFNQIPGVIPAKWDNEAITLKAQWAVFDRSRDCLVLPIWPGVDNPPTNPADFATWTQKVAVVRNITGMPRTCGGWSNLKEVSLSTFYNRPALSGNQLIVDPTPKQLQSEAINADALLVGMHIASNEVTNWLWATMWYGPGTNGTRVKGNPWSNYIINADISQASPPSKGHPNLSGTPLFSPYIEARLACNNCGVKTDCISCHSQASFGKRPEDQTLGFSRPGHSLKLLWSASDFVFKPQ